MTQQRRQQLLTLGATIATAIVAVVAVILLTGSQGDTRSNLDFDTIPQGRTNDGGFFLGDPDAPITVVEFTDFLCPYCQRYKSTINRIVEEFVVNGQARYEFRMLPTHEPSSSHLFRLAECIGTTEGHSFWEAHEEFFALANDGVNPNDIGREVANRLSISYTQILECAEDLRDANEGQFLIDRNVGQGAGVGGTPTVMVRYGNPEAPLQPVSSNPPSYETLRDLITLVNAQP